MTKEESKRIIDENAAMAVACTYNVLFTNDIVSGLALDAVESVRKSPLFRYKTKQAVNKVEREQRKYEKTVNRVVGDKGAFFADANDVFLDDVRKHVEILYWSIKREFDKAGLEHPGFNNKMFVAADMMIHQIRITNVRVEKLQDISDDDCLKEGVVANEPKIKGGINMYYPCEYLRSCAKEVGWGRVFHTPREAFAHLINKVSRKDVWNENPYVFVYDFELVK